jgi:hypothetical protein
MLWATVLSGSDEPNRKAFKFGGTCAGPGFARGEGEGTEDSDGCRPRLAKGQRALRGLLGGLPPSFALLCAPAGPSPFYDSSAAGVDAGVRNPLSRAFWRAATAPLPLLYRQDLGLSKNSWCGPIAPRS